jgi:hypothetical protein
MSSQEYYVKYLAKPGDGKCPVCGKPTLFRSLGQGFREFCGKKCAAQYIANDTGRNAHKVNALKSTMQREYNVENPALLDSVKEKRKNTMKERYGVEFYSQHPDFKERCHDGCFNKFGEISYARTAEWLERVKKTNNEKYGADFWVKNRLNISIDYYTRELAKYGCRLLSHPDKVHLTYVCDKCGNTMDDTTFFVNCRLHLNSTPCSHCVPKRNFRSLSEMNVEKVINSDAGHAASDEGNTFRKEEPELPVYTNVEGDAAGTSIITPRKPKKNTRMVPDSEIAAEYDELVRPFNCRVIHVDKRKNAKLLCNRCGQISKVFVPILRVRAENGVFPCGYCIPEHPEKVPRDENGRMILDDIERPTEVNDA